MRCARVGAFRWGQVSLTQRPSYQDRAVSCNVKRVLRSASRGANFVTQNTAALHPQPLLTLFDAPQTIAGT